MPSLTSPRSCSGPSLNLYGLKLAPGDTGGSGDAQPLQAASRPDSILCGRAAASPRGFSAAKSPSQPSLLRRSGGSSDALSQEAVAAATFVAPRAGRSAFHERSFATAGRSGTRGGSQDRGQHQASAAPPRSRSPEEDDPHRLRRFTRAQKGMHEKALTELRTGRKSSGWMWYIIPTPPYIVKGVERGSADNRRYALRSDDEVQAYLEFIDDSVDLKNNYFEIMKAVRDQLLAGKHPTSLLGKLSAPKLESSVRLFERVTRGNADQELHAVLGEILDLLEVAR